jgi:hypothetical protein
MSMPDISNIIDALTGLTAIGFSEPILTELQGGVYRVATLNGIVVISFGWEYGDPFNEAFYLQQHVIYLDDKAVLTRLAPVFLAVIKESDPSFSVPRFLSLDDWYAELRRYADAIPKFAGDIIRGDITRVGDLIAEFRAIRP